VIYLDSSALLKLVFEERESADLERWLSRHDAERVVSSVLAEVEVVRASRRLGVEAVPAARALTSGLDVIPVTGDLIDLAVDVGEPLLRSLDALHLASALSIGADISAFVAYDHRLSAAAGSAGLEVISPGT
jgi:predicted nucleic acid-binding protein